MILSLLASLALAGAPQPTDLDGDGKAEIIKVEPERVVVGAASLECYSEPSACDVAVVDIRGDDKRRELSVCEAGPRDDVSCTLYAYKAGKLIKIPVLSGAEEWWPSAFEITGNGFVYTDGGSYLYKRRDKYALQADGLTLKLVPQPFYYAGAKVHVDRTFPITMDPGGGAVVANARPDSDVELVLEHGQKPGFYLVKLSSGLVGWASLEALMGASDNLQMLMSAG